METIKTSETLLPLYKKLHEVMKAITFIAKDKTNTFHKYNYASESAIKEAVHAELVKVGLIFNMSIESLNRTQSETKNGGKTFITDLTILYSFIDIDTGVKLEGRFVGTGEDSADKGTYKAITGAIKYILTTNFLIPTGEDPEAEKSEPQPAKQSGKITPNEQANELPWLSDKETSNWVAAILNGEPAPTNLKELYRISNANKAKLNEAVKQMKKVEVTNA